MGTKRYLGNSVYVEILNGMYRLTTENGDFDSEGESYVSNIIYLEPEVLKALISFSEQMTLRDKGE